MPFDIDRGICNRERLGEVLGGVAGAAIGSSVGKGSGQKVAIVSGAIIGVIVDGRIGKAMDEVDQNCVGQILEHAHDERRVSWRDGSKRYAVTPVKTYLTQDGRYCRAYKTDAVIGGRKQQVFGTACRHADDSWEAVGRS